MVQRREIGPKFENVVGCCARAGWLDCREARRNGTSTGSELIAVVLLTAPAHVLLAAPWTNMASMPLHHQALQQPRHWACWPRSGRYTVFVRASSAQEEPSTSEAYQFTYRGSDGRLKATFEQAFKGGQASGAVGGAGAPPAAPWALGYQMAEKNLAWNDDLKARLIEVGCCCSACCTPACDSNRRAAVVPSSVPPYLTSHTCMAMRMQKL